MSACGVWDSVCVRVLTWAVEEAVLCKAVRQLFLAGS